MYGWLPGVACIPSLVHLLETLRADIFARGSFHPTNAPVCLLFGVEEKKRETQKKTLLLTEA